MIDNDPGRASKRQNIVLVVDLVPLRGVSASTSEAEEHERTDTDNISVQGARVHSARPWQPGEQVKVIPVNKEAAVRGEIVYCQKHGQDFLLGIRLSEMPVVVRYSVRYATLTFDSLQIVPLVTSNPSARRMADRGWSYLGLPPSGLTFRQQGPL